MAPEDRESASSAEAPLSGGLSASMGAVERLFGDAAPFSTGRTHHRPIRTYDFRRPDKLSKDHLRALEAVHETFSRLAVSTLSSYLRMVIQVQLIEVEQVTYGEYIGRLTQPTAVYLVTLDPLPGRILMEIDISLAQSLIDRVMGGAGRPLHRARPITEVEVTLLKNMMTSLLLAYKEAWQPIERLTPELGDIVFNPEVLQAALPGDSVALMRFEVRMGGLIHTLTLCLPYTTLEHVLTKLSAEGSPQHSQNADQQDGRIEQLLVDVDVPVVAVLGSVKIPVRELLSLEVGHIILLETLANQPVELHIGDSPRFRGAPGLVGRRLAVKIDELSIKEHTYNEPEPRVSGIEGGFRQRVVRQPQQ